MPLMLVGSLSVRFDYLSLVREHRGIPVDGIVIPLGASQNYLNVFSRPVITHAPR